MTLLHIFALFGYAVCIMMMLGLTASWFLMALFGLGMYNLGGVENPGWLKLVILSLGLVLFFAWQYLLAFINVSVSFQ